MARKRRLQWFDDVVRQSEDRLGKTILEGMVDGKGSRVSENIDVKSRLR